MNKIFIEDIDKKDLYLKDNTTLIIKESHANINIKTENDIKIFIVVLFSKINITYETSNSGALNIFSVDTSCEVDIKLLKEDINFNYTYSTINIHDNNYQIDINHFGNNITSKITNHGITTTNDKLIFTVNTIVPKNSLNIKTNQDSKIILLQNNNATIKPNLLIDNDDIEAEHSAYIGRFKEEELFYIMSRGISRKNAIDLLVKSFLISNMDVTDEQKDSILENINKYWR